MKLENYFYNCSKDYINSIEPRLFNEVTEIIEKLPKRNLQAEINLDLFYLFLSNGWAYDKIHSKYDENNKKIIKELDIIKTTRSEILNNRNKAICNTSTTLNLRWLCDFAKKYNNGIVQIEAQFGKIESMFKDFCGFKIAYYEKRLTLGIEIVMSNPNKYFEHRKSKISGMAFFNIAKETIQTINLDCPIWLIGIKER